MEMGDQYGLPDLRRFLARRTHFPANPQPSDPYFTHRNNIPPLPPPYHEASSPAATFMMGNGMAIPSSFVRFGHDHFTASSTAIAGSSSPSSSLFGVEMDGGGWSFGAMDVGNSRWPRQETLSLLEIRSRLDAKFKEANQKGPLWDEVSR